MPLIILAPLNAMGSMIALFLSAAFVAASFLTQSWS